VSAPSAAHAVVRHHHIDGQDVPSADGRVLESISPTTGQPAYAFARAGAEDVDRAVRAARRAFDDPSWRRTTPTQRGAMLRRLADLVVENAEALAQAETSDNGKLIREMRVQARVALPETLYYFAGLADKLEGSVIPALRPTILNYTLREPLGVIAAITPWNSPLLLTANKLAPALAAGNAVVVKPSEHSSASMLDMARMIEEAGFPPGIVNVVTGLGSEAGDALVRHPLVDKVAFTGGTATGRRIAQAAGERLIGTMLELGGKSPNIVFDDADPHNAALGVVSGIFAAAGQSCIAGSRLLLERGIYDEVLERVVQRASQIVIGDPLEDETELGPLAFEEHRENVARHVASAVDEGATLRLGGQKIVDRGGWYFEPTILTDVSPSMRVAQEEIFGPVLSVIPFEGEEEALEIANATRFGLAAGVWTKSLSRAHRMAARLDAGTVWINTYRSMSPMSPFGGFKDSGLGSENGFGVMSEMTRVKSVWVNTDDGPTPDPFVLGVR